MKLISAIDPGTSGGFAWLDEDGEAHTCPGKDRAAFVEVLRGATDAGYDRYVYMEKVSGYYPKPKAKPGEKEEFNLQASAFSMFNFGKSAGIPIGICEAFGIVPVEIMPNQWQKILFTKKSGTRAQWKNTLKEIAQRRYPDVKVTLWNADALLILSYATLIVNGEISIEPEKKK